MTKLYELTEQYKELAALADCEEMKEAVADTLEGLAGEFNDKAKAITSLILNMSSDAGAIDQEIERLKAKKQVITNRQEALKDYLRTNMERTGIKKITCPLFTITCVQGREIVHIDNEKELPDAFLAVKTVISPDKKEIEARLKSGEAVPGAHLERCKSSIRIK